MILSENRFHFSGSCASGDITPVRRGMRMRIKQVKAWWVRIPIETARQHRSDFGQVRTFDAAILRIETDDGIVGWGEGKNAAGSAGNLRRAGPYAEPRGRAAIDRPRSARHRPDLGDAVQRHARRNRGRRRPRHAADRAARHVGRRDQRGRHRAVGHFRQSRPASRSGACSAAASWRRCRPMPRAAGKASTRSATSSNPTSTRAASRR